MNYFSNFNPVFIIILFLLGFIAISILSSSSQIENYEHFNTFFCSGWAGNCLSN